MKKNTGNALTIIVIIVAVLAVGYWVFGKRGATTLQSSPTPSVSTSSAPTLSVNGKTISLIVADTPESRELGLSGRVSLPENEAMLFVFETPGPYEFWMKDMKIPIDIMWLDEAFKVIYIQENVDPETYPDETFGPNENALYVLEANAQFAQKNNVKVGDVLNITLKK